MAEVAHEPAADAAAQRSQRGRQAIAMLNTKAKVAGDYSTAHIRAHPLRSVGVALGAGLVLGALLLG